MADGTGVTWPNGARCAVMLTFDFDAETLWLSRDPANAKRPGTLSQGVYGGRRAVPELLAILREEGLPATFFVPGWTAERWTDRVEAILADGHEVGHHGYLHEWVDPDRPDLEREALEKGLTALEKTVGVRPIGYRSPAGESSAGMIALLQEYGFLYDSSYMTDVVPYRHVLAEGAPGPVELPWHWSTDDAPYALFAVTTPRPMFTNEHIFSIWRDEFDVIRQWGGLFNLVMHPQFTGRPARTVLLRRMIAHIRAHDDVWFATGEQVARAFAAQERASS